MVFPGRAAAHKATINICNAKHQLEWCKVHHWTLEQVFSGVMNIMGHLVPLKGNKAIKYNDI